MVVGAGVRMDGRTDASRARGAVRESIVVWAGLDWCGRE